MSMLKIGMIGDYNSVMGFKAMGIETYVVQDSQKASEILWKMARSDYGIVFVVEDVAEKIMDVIEEVNRETFCSVILVPGIKGSKGLAISKIGKNVEKAVGMDIFKT